MSMLSHDYRLYYRNSVVSINVDGVIYPFKVDDISYDFNHYDPMGAYAESEGVPVEDLPGEEGGFHVPDSFVYNQEAYGALRFVGSVRNFDGSCKDDRVASYSEMVLDNPDLGYVNVDGEFHYVDYRPIRAAKKGVIGDRLMSSSLLISAERVSRIVGAALDPNKDSDIKLGGALLLKESVEYKGRMIGTYDRESGTVTLSTVEANYLKRFIERGVEGCQVITA